MEILDGGRYEFTCINGHQTITILKQQKFEILFDIGAYAIIDGYYREAVSSFTSSLERFYEFYIKVITINKSIDKNSFILVWKLISGKSERQLGAFILLYTIMHGHAPALLSQSNVEFRNDVVHKGKIPTRTEALRYGNDVLKIIRPILNNLKENYKDSISKVISQYLSDCRRDNDKSVSTTSVATILSPLDDEPGHNELMLEDAMLLLKMMKSQQKG